MAQSEHLDKAERARRELLDADDWEEDTARTDVHVHMHSEHDGDEPQVELGPVKFRGLPKWAIVVIAMILAGATALISRLFAK